MSPNDKQVEALLAPLTNPISDGFARAVIHRIRRRRTTRRIFLLAAHVAGGILTLLPATKILSAWGRDALAVYESGIGTSSLGGILILAMMVVASIVLFESTRWLPR